MYDSTSKKSGEKPIKIFLKSSIKLNNYKDEEKPIKENNNAEKEKLNINISSELNNNNNNKIIHKNKLEEIEQLEKELENLEKENNLLTKEKSSLIEKQKKYSDQYNKIIDEIDSEQDELEELRNINDEKNREYLQLNHLRHQQQISSNNNNNNSSERNNSNNDSNNNNENEGLNEMLNGLNFLLNISRMRRANEEDGEDSQIYLASNNNDEDREEGPAMTHAQLEALPSISYPRNNYSNEKCVICGFEFCYKDTVTKLNCNHSFHKNCLINRLEARRSSKCPTCKASII
jgi:hypothetical protein